MENKLKKLMKAALKTSSLRKLSVATGIPHTTLADWLKSNGTLKLQQAFSVAEFLGLQFKLLPALNK